MSGACLREDALVLLFVGRIQPLKAPDVLVRAAAELLEEVPEADGGDEPEAMPSEDEATSSDPGAVAAVVTAVDSPVPDAPSAPDGTAVLVAPSAPSAPSSPSEAGAPAAPAAPVASSASCIAARTTGCWPMPR